MGDRFFTQTRCDRCGKELEARTMSWFTKETICLDCSKKEQVIKAKLREKGLADGEGCGYIPEV